MRPDRGRCQDASIQDATCDPPLTSYAPLIATAATRAARGLF